MRRSREQTAETRRRAVDAASRLYRTHGLDAVSVGDVMEEIGMTVGGFYKHFASKEALVVEACQLSFDMKQQVQEERQAADGPDTIEQVLARYLSPKHRDSSESGCPVPGMLSSVQHHSDIRPMFTDAIGKRLTQIESLSAGLQSETQLTMMASMYGALALARAVDDPDLQDRLIDETLRYWLNVVDASKTNT